MAGEKKQKETFAIPDDEIDIRLIQQQISSALGKASPSGKGSTAGATPTNKQESAPPPLLKPEGKEKAKVEDSKQEANSLPQTIDLFAESGITSPLRTRPPMDGEPEIVEIEHSVPKEKLTPEVQTEYTVNIPPLEDEEVSMLEHSVRIPSIDDELENTLEHSILQEEGEKRQLEHSVKADEVPQKIQLEHSKPQVTINDIAQAEHSFKEEEEIKTTLSHAMKEVQQSAAPAKSSKSKEDSMDINELMHETDGEISLDFLNQLTNRINSEMGVEEDVELPHSTPQEYMDEEESNINIVAAQEEQMVEDIINQENEKTIVTEQICEYPVNTMDSEYIQALDYLDGDKRYKKYVIYIDEINQEFLDSLSIQERKDVINTVLREQDDMKKARLAEERRKKLVSVLMFFIICVFVLVPLLFLMVNKCMEATIQNYRRNQDNWEVLFKENSKIKKTTTTQIY